MNLIHPISIALILIFSMPNKTLAAGFTVDLIHIDSLQSPSLYSISDRLKTTLQRSYNRVQTLHRSPSAALVSHNGEYLLNFSIGTPAIETLAIADTGSDLTWIQCKPCIKCFNQKLPIFDPARSSTYKPTSCSSESCRNLPMASCENTCSYTLMYGDSSYSKGDVATETIRLGPNVSIPDVTFGCGHSDKGTFSEGTSGIVGLGGGKLSLISQMGGMVGGRFSYCLVPNLFGESYRSSKMNFGENALVRGHEVVSTPMFSMTPDTYYFLRLEGITIGNQSLYYSSYQSPSQSPSPSTDVDEGNMIIDSGTTLILLVNDLYERVVSAVRGQMLLKEISDPAGLLETICYPSKENEFPKVPEMTVHFRGADVKLKAENTFVHTTPTSMCLAFGKSHDGVGIYGNLAQLNFVVGYDLKKRSVYFKPSDCSKE